MEVKDSKINKISGGVAGIAIGCLAAEAAFAATLGAGIYLLGREKKARNKRGFIEDIIEGSAMMATSILAMSVGSFGLATMPIVGTARACT